MENEKVYVKAVQDFAKYLIDKKVDDYSGIVDLAKDFVNEKIGEK